MYWFSFKNNSTDYPTISAFHYSYSYLYYTLTRTENNVGYETFIIKRQGTIVTLEFTFYDRDYLDRFVGSSTIDTETQARRIGLRFFTNCDVQDVIYNQSFKR